MTFRDRMSALADRMRALPPRLSERPTTVTIRTKTWAGGRRGADGGAEIVDLLLTPTPKVREIRMVEIAASAGRYDLGDFRIGPITPAYAGGGGYTEAQLSPVTDDSGVEIIYVLAGFVSGEFARIDLSTDRSHSWILTLRKRRVA